MAAPAGRLEAPPVSAWARGPPASFRTAARPVSSSLFPPIKLAARQASSKDGCPAISFTPSEVHERRQRLQHSLIAKFSGGRLKVADVRRAFEAAWALEGEVSIGAWDARHILIILKSEEDARRVLSHPMRKIDQYYFRLFRWTPDFHVRKESTIISTWVRLPELPPDIYDQGYIQAIVSTFGKFITIDEKTKQFTNPSFARACVEINVSSPIPEKIWIGVGGQSYWQYLEFENKLFYCSKCKVHGHRLSGCRKVKVASVHAGDKTQATAVTSGDRAQMEHNQSPNVTPDLVQSVEEDNRNLNSNSNLESNEEGWQIQRKGRKSHNRKEWIPKSQNMLQRSRSVGDLATWEHDGHVGPDNVFGPGVEELGAESDDVLAIDRNLDSLDLVVPHQDVQHAIIPFSENGIPRVKDTTISKVLRSGKVIEGGGKSKEVHDNVLIHESNTTKLNSTLSKDGKSHPSSPPQC